MENEEKTLQKRVNGLYKRDCALVFMFLALLWVILLFVLSNVVTLKVIQDMGVGIYILAGAVGAIVTSALIGVFFHLRRHKEDIYREDIANQEALKGN